MAQAVVDAGEAPAEDAALADLYSAADDRGEQDRLDQLEEHIGAKGETAVHVYSEVHQIAERDLQFHDYSLPYQSLVDNYTLAQAQCSTIAGL